MAAEQKVIEIINQNLKRILKTKPFQMGEFGYIAELIPYKDGAEEQGIVPAIVDNYGNCTYLGIDDKFPFQCYYILNGYDGQSDDNFGNKPLVKKQISSWSMIVYGYRPTLQITKEQLISAVDAAFPNQLTNAENTYCGILNGMVSDPKYNVDKQSVFNSQVGINELYLQPEYILFAVDFQIETQINTACYEVC